MSTEIQILRDQSRLRREVLIHHILHGLEHTIQLRGKTPETPIEDVHVDFTDKSVEFIAPLVEAIDILETIIFASDGCAGHKQCLHSMEPWQRARKLLEGKWRAAENHEQWPALKQEEIG